MQTPAHTYTHKHTQTHTNTHTHTPTYTHTLQEFYGSVKGVRVKGLTEFGFMSSTKEKSVATNYSKVAEGNPMATVLSMQCGAVDRAAPITEFSQFPGEEEWLWTPMCYVEPEPEWQQLIDVTPHGVVRVIPVCVCVCVCV